MVCVWCGLSWERLLNYKMKQQRHVAYAHMHNQPYKCKHLKFVRTYSTFTFTVLLPMTVHYQQMAICLCYSELKLVCRTLLYAEWGFYSWGRRDEEMQRRRTEKGSERERQVEREEGRTTGLLTGQKVCFHHLLCLLSMWDHPLWCFYTPPTMPCVFAPPSHTVCQGCIYSA